MSEPVRGARAFRKTDETILAYEGGSRFGEDCARGQASPLAHLLTGRHMNSRDHDSGTERVPDEQPPAWW